MVLSAQLELGASICHSLVILKPNARALKNSSYFPIMKASLVLALLVIVAAVDEECQENGNCIYSDITKASNALSTDLYKIASKIEKGNIMASAPSLELVLAVISTGSYGETQKEILTALHVPQDIPKLQANYKSLLATIDNSQVTIATQLFLAKEFIINKQFAKQASDNFQSGVQNVDFMNSRDAVKDINNFIIEKTNGKIKDIVQEGSIDQTIKLLLINTLYFKGKWSSPFKVDLTRKGAPFYLTNDKSKRLKADLMYQSGTFKYLNVEELDSQMVELPFEGKGYKMVIILPNQPEGISYVESTMKDDPQFFANFEGSEERKVDITLPKMRVLVDTDFKDYLKKLGVNSMFHPSANCYGIVENDIGKLLVSSVIQKVFLNVDEAGAEAAAVTSTSISQRRSADEPVEFIADHPFLFAIVQTSNNLVLFQGRFSKPQ